MLGLAAVMDDRVRDGQRVYEVGLSFWGPVELAKDKESRAELNRRHAPALEQNFDENIRLRVAGGVGKPSCVASR